MSDAIFLNVSNEDSFVEGTVRVPAHSSLGEYLSWASDNNKMLTKNDAQLPIERPFLSVLMRTQGTRIQELNEVLLCLSAQTNGNFEVVLLGHNVSANCESEVLSLIEDQPQWLRDRIFYTRIEGGNRTRPLSVGFRVMRGEYGAILDDDDIVFDTWVDEFCKLASDFENFGKILHCGSFTQEWEAYDTQTCNRLLRSSGLVETRYCHVFNQADQLFSNQTPTLSLAFPRYVTHDLGFIPNETLTTNEDWDFLMRAYLLCGICDSLNSTSIYRLWVNTSNSHTLHRQEEWSRNHESVASLLDSIPLLLGKKTRTAIQKQKTSEELEYADTFLRETCELQCLFDGQSAFFDTEDIPTPTLVDDHLLEFNLDGLISEIVFRPTKYGSCTMSAFCATVIDKDGSEQRFDLARARSNGFQVDCSHVVFLQEEPKIFISLKTPINVERVRIYVRINPGVREFHLDQVTRGAVSLWLGRTKRWLLRRLGTGD